MNFNIRNIIINMLLFPVFMIGTEACFTGVESTPRIKASDVSKQHAATVSAEQLFLSDIRPEPPAKWLPGKEYKITNDRISLIFTSSSDNTQNLAGHRMKFSNFESAISLTGKDAIEAVFIADDGRKLIYLIPGVTESKLDTVSTLDIPFAVDLDIVARIDSTMRGNHYYVRTPAWYSGKNQELIKGMRHVGVTVDSVVAGNENFPAAVYFTLNDEQYRAKVQPDGSNDFVLMSIGNSRAATRNFDTLFSFTDPRKAYPDIKDDIWDLIINSKIQKGMTRDECRLALGSPSGLERIPTYGGMVERWSYTDGVYILFEDGLVTRYRQ